MGIIFFLCCRHINSNPEVQIQQIMRMSDDSVKVGLSEGTVIFMKEQSPFAHAMARLLKFWSHSVLVSGYFNGRSYTMELFAVWASEEECNNDMLRGFRLALDKIRNFKRARKAWTRFYSATEADNYLAMTDCALLDPTDPANNL